MTTYREFQDRFDISLSSIYEAITFVPNFICSLAPEYIRWPTTEEAKVTKAYYLGKNDFPNVIGLIDGTHVRINRPEESQDSYYNRKDYFSLQVQIVCDQNLKIIDFAAGYPGSVHDARVFRRSPLYFKLTTETINKYFYSMNVF